VRRQDTIEGTRPCLPYQCGKPQIIKDTSFVDMALDTRFKSNAKSGMVFGMECRRRVVQPDEDMASTQTGVAYNVTHGVMMCFNVI
jgi:hypothetical protein